jgi:hypothetical protein
MVQNEVFQTRLLKTHQNTTRKVVPWGKLTQKYWAIDLSTLNRTFIKKFHLCNMSDIGMLENSACLFYLQIWCCFWWEKNVLNYQRLSKIFSTKSTFLVAMVLCTDFGCHSTSQNFGFGHRQSRNLCYILHANWWLSRIELYKCIQEANQTASSTDPEKSAKRQPLCRSTEIWEMRAWSPRVWTSTISDGILWNAMVMYGVQC